MGCIIFELHFRVSVPGGEATRDMRGYLGRLKKYCVLTLEWLSRTAVLAPNLKCLSLFERASQQSPVFEIHPE